MTPEQLVEQLKQTLGTRLSSVVLYGSAATGEFTPGVSNYNVLVVATPIDLALLDDMMPIVWSWMRKGNRPPLLFTPEDLRTSADSFPIELMEIQACGRVLWGKNPLDGVPISEEHLRLQLEREFKGKLLALREGYLRTGGKPRQAAALLVSAVSGVLVVFRAALRLFRDSVPAGKEEALRLLAEQTSFDPQPWLNVAAIKRGELSARRVDVRGLFDSCLKVLEQVAGAVDRQLHPKR